MLEMFNVCTCSSSYLSLFLSLSLSLSMRLVLVASFTSLTRFCVVVVVVCWSSLVSWRVKCIEMKRCDNLIRI